MLFILFLVFVVTPIVELAVIVQVAGSTGVLNTIGLLVLVSTPVEPATCTMTANSTIGVTTNTRNRMNNTTAC